MEIDFQQYPRVVDRALVRALNRGIGAGRTFMVKEIARDTKLKSADIKAALRMQEATLSRPEARLASSLRPIPLIKFNARGPRPSYGRGRGVSYSLGGSRGNIPNAFIARMPNNSGQGTRLEDRGHEGVFTRSSKKRLPIKEKFGPSMGHVFAKYRAGGLARTQESFVKTFDHEMKYRTSSDASGPS